MSKFELQDKVAIVTGGAGNIGICICREFARAGARAIIADAKEPDSEFNTIVTDITIPEQVDNLVKQTVDTYGRLDILVNCAGAWGKASAPEDASYEEWVAIIDLNLTGTFLCCRAAGKQMIKQKSGKIINISSIAGTKGAPGVLHYSAAKAGIISLSNNLAYMWAQHNIRVNTIVPGLIATQMLKDYGMIPPDIDEDGNPVPRLELPPDPEDLANLALFLASEASDSITGEQIPIRRWCKTDRFWQ